MKLTLAREHAIEFADNSSLGLRHTINVIDGYIKLKNDSKI
jgi:hypothetical protein